MAELNLSNCYNPLLINAFWEKRPVKDLRMEFNRRYFTALGGLMDEIEKGLADGAVDLKPIVIALYTLHEALLGLGNVRDLTNTLLTGTEVFAGSIVWQAISPTRVPWMGTPIRYIVADAPNMLVRRMPDMKRLEEYYNKKENYNPWFVDVACCPMKDRAALFCCIDEMRPHEGLKWKPLTSNSRSLSNLGALLAGALRSAQFVETFATGCLPFNNPFYEFVTGRIDDLGVTFRNAIECLDSPVFRTAWRAENKATVGVAPVVSTAPDEPTSGAVVTKTNRPVEEPVLYTIREAADILKIPDGDAKYRRKCAKKQLREHPKLRPRQRRWEILLEQKKAP